MQANAHLIFFAQKYFETIGFFAQKIFFFLRELLKTAGFYNLAHPNSTCAGGLLVLGASYAPSVG